jgi:hypothetical protein
VYVRSKVIGGKPRHYLCRSERRDGKPRQVVLAYLGAFDNVEDAYANATGRRRTKLGKFRNPADVINERIEEERIRTMQREHRAQLQAAQDAVKTLLPRLHQPAYKPTPISPAVEKWADEIGTFFKDGWR